MVSVVSVYRLSNSPSETMTNDDHWTIIVRSDCKWWCKVETESPTIRDSNVVPFIVDLVRLREVCAIGSQQNQLRVLQQWKNKLTMR